MVAKNAGLPATPADLIDVDEVVGAYYDVVPDPSVPEQRVIFGTSGHRGSSLKTSFNEAHIVAISQAIAEYRKAAGVDGPEPAGMEDRDRGARGERRDCMHRFARRLHAHAGGLPGHSHAQPCR